MEAGFIHFIEQIRTRLQQPLPGILAQNKMAPSIRNYQSFNHEKKPRQSAVMILLFEKNTELYTAFFKRPEYEGHHGGQIAFPGGKCDRQDKNIEQTALRETEEEFGIPQQSINVLGMLSKLYIPISNLDVSPFVGYIASMPIFMPNPKEVEYIIEIPICQLIDDSYKTVLKKQRHSIEIETPMYVFGHNEIWGATAMITSEFEEIIRDISTPF